MDQPFRVDPAQGGPPDGELPRIVNQQDGITQETVGMNAAPQSPLGSNPPDVLNNRQARLCRRGDANPAQVGLPRGLIGEMRLPAPPNGDQETGQPTVAQIRERRLVQHIIWISGAEQIEEVQSALRSAGAEPGNESLPIGAKPVLAGVPGASIVHRNEWRCRQPGTEDCKGFADERSCLSVEQTL